MNLDAETKLANIQSIVEGIEQYVKNIPINGSKEPSKRLTLVAYLALGFSIVALIRQETASQRQEINIDSPEAVRVIVEELLKHNRIQRVIDAEPEL